MFCFNCGNKLNGNEDFCSNCGIKIVKEDSLKQKNITLSEKMLKKSKNFIKNIIDKFKNFIIKHKKACLIIGILIFIIVIGILLFYFLFGFDKLGWDKKYSDLELEYVSQTNLKLGIDFKNKKKLKDLKYEITCGTLEKNGLEIDWDLSDSIGECKITVSYKLRKISKKFKVHQFNGREEELSLKNDINLDSDDDSDLDGLTNKQEKEYNTNPLVNDTDMDGLNDNYEISISKTEPTKKDTDNDGINDYDEIELGLDPLKADSKGDGIKDGLRELTYNYENDNLKIVITGTGNIASTVALINSNTKISNKIGLIDNLYTFYTDGTIKEAVVTITYTDELIEKYGLTEDNLSLYYYNEKELKYEKVETIIDKENNTLTAILKHFSNYVVGDTSLVKDKFNTEVLFVLDNSWSMYTNEQYKEITGHEYVGGLLWTSDLDGSDAEGLRFSLTSDLMTKLSKKDYKIGLSEFRSDYANALPIGSDINLLQEKLKTMNGNFITNNAGTDIETALTSGIKEFSEKNENKYIVLLTDGEDPSLSSYSDKIIKTAKEQDVKICSIGFGSGSNNTELAKISNTTGCTFYSASDADGLSELFDNMNVELNDDLVDIDGDGEVDGILVADSGFIVNKNGFSFENYGTNLSSGGHCYGMATFAQLYYKKQLPLKVEGKTVGEYSSYSYDLYKTYFKGYADLYNYKLKTNVLKYNFGFEAFDEKTPADLYTIRNNELTFNDKYRQEIIESNMYDLEKIETTLSKEEQTKKHGANYEKYEYPQLNETKMQNNNTIEYNDLQLLNAIYTGFIKQERDIYYSSGMDFVLWLRHLLGTETIDDYGAEGFINILKTRLNDQDPLVMSSTYSNGLHAVNAINLVQDIDNPNYYYIGVYDNNYPGEKRYVNVECKKGTCSTVANKYYSSSGNPLRITYSLEYDLKYYE